MNNVEIIEMLNKIEEYIKHEELESVLKYIDIKKKSLNIKKDIANEYMDKWIKEGGNMLNLFDKILLHIFKRYSNKIYKKGVQDEFNRNK